MKKPLPFFMIALASFLLGGCDFGGFSIFDLNSSKTNTDDNGHYIDSDEGVTGYADTYSLSDEPIRTPTEYGYDKVTSRHSYRNIGNSIGYHYLNPQGRPNILVLPVAISDYTRYATTTNLERIRRSFLGDHSNTTWESVHSFYQKSSFGLLDLKITVADSWYHYGKSTNEIVNEGTEEDGSKGVRNLLNSALAWFKRTYNFSGKRFDGDGDGYIDGVWLVYSAPDHSNAASTIDKLFWAFTSWTSNKPNKASPTANTFAWASWDFSLDGYVANSPKPEAHTFIHETGHMLGLDDYYSYDSDGSSPVGGFDMMDYNVIDHNSFSKFALSWAKPYLIDKTGSVRIKPFATDNECLIIPAGDWNGSCFDEYILVEYYTPTALNEKDSQNHYEHGSYPLAYNIKGVRIFHVDARIANYDGTKASYTNNIVASQTSISVVAHTNTKGKGYNYLNRQFRLLQIMDATLKRDLSLPSSDSSPRRADNTSLFQMSNVFSVSSYKNSFKAATIDNPQRMNNGKNWSYSLSFSDMNDEGVTVTIN